jgi:osmotically-inducible protein OsmY
MTRDRHDARHDADEPTQYLVARIRDTLAHDERVAALDINVKIVGDSVFLSGTVATPERRQACEQVVGELLPEHRVHNQLGVLAQDAPSGAEDLS